MNDAGTGRNHPKLVKRLLSPPEKRVSLLIALVLELDVAAKRECRTEGVDLHRVVYDQIGRHEGIDALGIATQAFDCRPHSREVNDRGNAREVLKDDASRQIRKFEPLVGGGFP
jgi:hypothetical protein